MKKGAASFYIVAFSTLVLTVIAASFATLIINEMTRTANDDLSQSAYDAAMAGIEDGKLALLNYKRCLESGATAGPKPTTDGAITCADIMYWVENSNDDCLSVAKILGRASKTATVETVNEVKIAETTSGSNNNLNQAYTCATIKMNLQDYRSTLSSSSSEKVVKVDVSDEIKNNIDKISAIKLSWFSNRDSVDYHFTNFEGNKVKFYPKGVKEVATPPTIAFQLIQTAQNFTMDQFTTVPDRNHTNRGIVYLVPSENGTTVNNSANFANATTTNNSIGHQNFADSNDRSSTVKPFVIKCDGADSENEFACTAIIYLPDPVGGKRNADTFMFVVSLPYEQPDTDFAIELICQKGTEGSCGGGARMDFSEYGGDGDTERNTMMFYGAQVELDSTGRANDLFRRVVTRVENTDTSFAYPFFAIQALADDNSSDPWVDKYLQGVTLP